MRSKLWHDTMQIALIASAPNNTWILPASLWESCADHMSAYLMLLIDYLETSGGNIDIEFQSCPIASTTDPAWVTVASAMGVTAIGPQVLVVTKTATNPITGVLRLKVTCNTAPVTFNLRAELLLKEEVESRLIQTWLPPTVIEFTGADNGTMDADQWLDCSRYVHAFGLCEYNTMSGDGNDLTVAMQTAPDFSSDPSAWLDTASATMGNAAAVLNGRMTVTNPPMGALRLRMVSTDALKGSLQVAVLLKGV